MTRRALVVPSLPALLWILVFLGTAYTAGSSLVSADGDATHHVVLGEVMLRERALLDDDPTSWLAEGREYVDHEWLAQLLLAALHQTLGLAGPALLASALFATAFVLAFRRLRSAGAGPWAALAIWAPALLAAKVHLLARPHLFTWTFVVVWEGAFQRFRRGEISWGRWLALSTPLVALWSNLHSGFLLVFFLLVVHAAAQGLAVAAAAAGERPRELRALRRVVLAGPPLLAASALNPYGLRLHAHFLAYMGNPYLTRLTSEWASPDFHDPAFLPFLALACLSIAVLVTSRRRPAADEWLLFLFLLASTLRAGRNAAYFGLLATPAVAAGLQALLEDAARTTSWLGAVARRVLASSDRLAAGDPGRAGPLAIAAALALAVAVPPPARLDPDRLPVDAVRYVRDHPAEFEGRMFNDYDWGGYLAYELHPSHRVGPHGLNDHQGESLVREARRIEAAAPGWEEALARREVGWTILRPGSPLAQRLDEDPGWRAAFRDSTAVVHVRRAE